MQLASYGTRALPARYLSRLIPHNPGINLNGAAARSIHIGPTPTTAGTGRKVIQQTRNVLTRFFAHLTAPGLRAPPTSFPTSARSLHTASRTGVQGIHANLSLHARHALSKGPFLPRAPMVPRTMTQVGLGTARNFSSTRPIFQNLAQNVPIAGRAFWEADFDIHGKPRHDWVRIGKENLKMQDKRNEMMKPNQKSSPLFTVQPEATPATEAEADLEHYFSTTNSRTAGVTSYLLIPLAPTPTTRHPLSASPPLRPRNRGDVERLLPISELATLHSSHTTHSLRVSTLFARLDAGNVWDKNVDCDAYGDGQGICTILRVSFSGWTAAEVRSVIGESGTGWCELHEVRSDTGTLSSSVSDIGSMSDLSSFEGDAETGGGFEMDRDRMDPSQSFVLPTLDFSSSSPGLEPPPTRNSTSNSFDETDTDLFSYPSDEAFSDVDIDSRSDFGVSSTFSSSSSSSSGDESWEQSSWHGSSMLGFPFSSEFARRLAGEHDARERPREYMF